MRYGTCPFCGQMMPIEEADDSWTDEELMRKAAERCNCPESITIQRAMKKREDARETVEELFEGDVMDVLADAIEKIGQTVRSVSVTGADGIHGTISVTVKGNIKVTRKNNKSITYEI